MQESQGDRHRVKSMRCVDHDCAIIVVSPTIIVWKGEESVLGVLVHPKFPNHWVVDARNFLVWLGSLEDQQTRPHVAVALVASITLELLL